MSILFRGARSFRALTAVYLKRLQDYVFEQQLRFLIETAGFGIQPLPPAGPDEREHLGLLGQPPGEKWPKVIPARRVPQLLEPVCNVTPQVEHLEANALMFGCAWAAIGHGLG